MVGKMDAGTMKLKYVSITGADDAVAAGALGAISAQYPFVEWAVLLMPESMGRNRFPSAAWIENFAGAGENVHKAMHLCGGAFLGFMAQDPAILKLMRGFRRIQLNLEFGAVEGRYDLAQLPARMKAHPEFEFIVQYTEKRRDFLLLLRDVPNHAVLFDQSAGRGVSPDSWPSPLDGHFCGYAGGINPDNIQDNLAAIARAAGGARTWIDMESGVRTDDRFDLKKVGMILEHAAPYAA